MVHPDHNIKTWHLYSRGKQCMSVQPITFLVTWLPFLSQYHAKWDNPSHWPIWRRSWGYNFVQVFWVQIFISYFANHWYESGVLTFSCCCYRCCCCCCYRCWCACLDLLLLTLPVLLYLSLSLTLLLLLLIQTASTTTLSTCPKGVLCKMSPYPKLPQTDSSPAHCAGRILHLNFSLQFDWISQ